MAGRAMSTQEIERLLREPLLARVGTVRPDGWAHVVPVWFEWDGGVLRFEAQSGSLKVRNLRRDPRASVVVDVTQGGYRYQGVMVQGVAEIMSERAAVVPIVERIFRQYIGSEGLRAPATRRLIHGSTPVIVEVTPTRIVSWHGARDGPEPRLEE